MEVSQVIHHPVHLHALASRALDLASSRCKRARTQNHHIQTSRWRIINPLRRERANTMQRRKIHLLRRNKLIPRLRAQIINIFHDKRIGECMLGQKHNLRASLRQLLRYCLPYARCAALYHSNHQHTARTHSWEVFFAHSNHNNLPVHVPLACIARAGEEALHDVQQCEPWEGFEDGVEEGHGVEAFGEDLRDDWDGHVWLWVAHNGREGMYERRWEIEVERFML